MSSHPYQHKQFPVGMKVRISSDILKLHALSPIAGKIGVATWGHYYIVGSWWATLDPVSEQIKKVPVEIGGVVYLVEPNFVSKV